MRGAATGRNWEMRLSCAGTEVGLCIRQLVLTYLYLCCRINVLIWRAAVIHSEIRGGRWRFCRWCKLTNLVAPPLSDRLRLWGPVHTESRVSWFPYRAHEPTESAHRIRTRSNRGSKVSRFGSVPGLVFVCTESARIPSSPLLCLLSSSEERWSEGRGAFTVYRRNEQSVFLV